MFFFTILLSIYPSFARQIAWFKSGKKYEEFYDDSGTRQTFNLYAYMRLFAKGTMQIENELLRRHTQALQSKMRADEAQQPLGAHDLDFTVDTILLDSSPGDRDPDHMRKIAHLLPDSKLIFMMRDPVERQFSAYRFRYQASERRRFREKHQNADEFDEYVMTELSANPAPFTGSYYNESIATALQLFQRENLLFVKFEDYVRSPSRYVSQHFLPFLGVAQFPVDVIEKLERQELRGKRHNDSKMKYAMLPQTRAVLRQHFTPFNSALAEILHDDTWTWGY